MRKEKIMILGAGIYQLPLILKAKDLGLEVIVSSIKGDYPGFKYADKVYYVNTTDEESILKICQHERINGICTASTDVAITSIGKVCDALKLNGITYQTGMKATNKLKMKTSFVNCGVNTAAFKVIKSRDDLLENLNKFNRNVILKIVDKSGSRGIVKVENTDDIYDIYDSIMKETHCSDILMEEFLEGKEIGIDGFIKGGEIQYIFPHDKITVSNGKTNVPAGHVFPLEMEKNVEDKLYEQVNLVIKALELDNCAFNIDAFIIDDEIFIIEAGARVGATGIPELIYISSGNDIFEQIINTALRKECNFTDKFEIPCMSYILYSSKGGVLKSISSITVDGVEFELDYKVGDLIPSFKNGTDRIGQIIIRGKNKEDLDHRKKAFLDKLNLEIE